MEHRFLIVAVAGVLAGMARGQSASSFGELGGMLPPDVSDTLAVALGDLDGDGDLDALIGNSGDTGSLGARTRLYRNDGTGRFDDATDRLPTDRGFTHAVALGDVDGDGDLDAFLGNAGQSWLWLNDGTGQFRDASAQIPQVEYVTTLAVALGDVDGDGDLDAVIGNRRQQNRLWINDGNGRFSDATDRVPSDSDWTQAVALGDVDADGDLDALIGNVGPSRLWLNDGTGRFSDATDRVPRDSDWTQAVALGDVDADGDLDALIGNGDLPEQNRLWVNDGTGRFSDATDRVPTFFDRTRAVALGDVDGDDDLDALIGNWVYQQNRLWLNDGTGRFSDATTSRVPTNSHTTQAVALGDVDGDGDLDALIGNGQLPARNRLWLNDGNGCFVDATVRVPIAFDWTQAVALGDVDGDGDLDALIGNGGLLEQNRLWLNDGTGRFRDASTRVPTVPDRTQAVALGDVDGDGDLDAVVGTGEQNRLWLNDGNGRFRDASSRVPTVRDWTQAVALGDVDGDGDLDALIGNGGFPAFDGQSRLWLNDGNGRFSDATAWVPSDSDWTQAVALGDVDGDGDLDALIGNGGYPTFNEQNRLWLNDGAGRFRDATSRIPTALDETTSVALGDVDGDGDLDALIGNSVHQPSRLWLNDGTGRFQDARALIPITFLDRTRAVALGDVDGDGDLDALIGNYRQQNRLWINDGTGRFGDATAVIPIDSDTTTAVALGDVDGDGDLDSLIGNASPHRGEFEGQNRLYTNLTRQVAWRAVPRVGKPLTIDVYGSPFGFWLLLASAGTADIRLPFGTLRLDPTRHVQVAAGLLDPQGRASHTDRVPADASLVGISVHWQAVVSVPLALTNLETTTFTNL